MILYIDITQLEKQRVNTGIQRVVKEFLNNILKNSNFICNIIIYNKTKEKYQLLLQDEVILFLEDIKKYKFKSKKYIDIESIRPTKLTIFYDIDSPWHAAYNRAKLYPILHRNNIKIFHFLHDMIPIVVPQYVQEATINNFIPFMKLVYKYSDMVIYNSIASQNDFLKYKKVYNIKRNILVKVAGLGSDFFIQNTKQIDKKYIDIINRKYILFVGTLEPRKNQKDILAAFDELSKKYQDLNLIFIGMKGWNIDDLIHNIQNNTLYNKRLYWLQNIDDDLLYYFYKNAFIVTYLSKYEGYGLPIVEALQHGNITITSNNSSMPEVGGDFVDYVDNNAPKQLINIISKYYDDIHLYNNKKKYIKQNFKPLTWKQYSNNIFDIFYSYKKEQEKMNLKQIIKSIPVLGWLSRWGYNLIRLNNLKHMVYQQQQQIKKQQKQIDQLISQNSKLKLFDTKQSMQIYKDIVK